MVNNDQKFFDKLFLKANLDMKVCIFGDTANPEKFAYKIKNALQSKGYSHISCIDKEYDSLASLNQNIDLLILCMHPAKSIGLLTGQQKYLHTVIIQPGAESEAIIDFLKMHHIDYTCGCVLKYFSLQ